MQHQPEASVQPGLSVPARRFNWKKYGPLWALFALIILGSLLNPQFLSAANLLNVMTRSSFIGIIAIGMTFVIIAGGIDLSVGSMAAFISGVTIMTLNYLGTVFQPGWAIIVMGMGLALLIGISAGIVNGLLITKGRIEAFIVTLGAMGIFRSLVIYLAEGGTISLDFGIRGIYRPVYYETLLGIPLPVLIFLGVACLGGVILNKTRFGRYCFAIGSNEQVARYSAIHVDRMKTATYVLLGACVALATIIYVPRLGSASGQTGILWELEAIAAVIIGGTALKGGYGHIWGTVVGALMLSMIGNILNLTDFISQHLNGAVQGVIIVAAAFLQRGYRR